MRAWWQPPPQGSAVSMLDSSFLPRTWCCSAHMQGMHGAAAQTGGSADVNPAAPWSTEGFAIALRCGAFVSFPLSWPHWGWDPAVDTEQCHYGDPEYSWWVQYGGYPSRRHCRSPLTFSTDSGLGTLTPNQYLPTAPCRHHLAA